METNPNAFRLSPCQRHVWLQGHHGGEQPFRIRASIRIEGSLDEAILEKTLVFLTRKYEILRTDFIPVPEMFLPLQIIKEDQRVCLTNMGQMDDEEKDGSWEVRFHLRGSGSQHWLDLDIPLMCMDWAGLRGLTAELAHLYASGGEEPPPIDEDEQPLQYVDLSEWMHDLLVSEETKAGRTYWLSQDITAQKRHRIPLAQESGEIHAGTGAFQPQRLKTELAHSTHQAMLALARDLTVTPAEIVLACWFLLLYRSGMQSPLHVGCAMNGRGHEDLGSVPGLFARNIPVALSWDEEFSFRDWVRKVAETMEVAAKWQDFFAWESPTSDDADEKEPAFSAIAFQAIPEEDPQGTEPAFILEPMQVHLERFQLSLAYFESGHLQLAFEPLMFRRESAALLLDRLLVILAHAPTNAEASINRLPMMPERERTHLLVQQSPVIYDRNLCFHQHFSSLAHRFPHKPAILSAKANLTYSELDQRANGLARILLTRGVRPGDRIVLYMDRTPEMIIALLAVLKTGAAYVPLDPGIPQTRTNYILEDCQARLVLTQKVHADAVSDKEHLVIDAAHLAVLDAFEVLGDAQNLAYIIYTSGTTGLPKGVCITHRALMNYLFGVLDRLALAASDILTTFATVAADLGNTSLFGALGSGRAYRILSDALRLDADGLEEELGRQPMDFLKIVPSHLNILLTGARPEKVLPRHCLALGGEACNPLLVQRIRELAPGCRVINHYGPTETTIGITTYELEEAGNPARSMPIGKALQNARAYIVDQTLNPVPLDAVGELCLGGESLAQGYWQRPALTAEKFVPDPFSLMEGERLYRSGDLARLSPDGHIHLHNRIDHQVKIRGFRVELGEIEATLTQHPSISEAVVVAERDKQSGARLCAHLVFVEGEDPTHADLSRWLGERLPQVMHPSHFSVLQAIPRNANGKVDRAALPPAHASKALKTEFVAPANPMEAQLSQMWCELLQVESISVNDNFLDLGAHSFLIIRANKKIRESFDREISIVDLYRYPNIRALARFLEGGGERGVNQQSVDDRADRKRQAMTNQRLRQQRKGARNRVL